MRRNTDLMGLRLIVGFKLLKAALELTIGIILLSLLAAGFAHRFMDAAVLFRHHVAEVWSVKFAEILIQAATVRHLSVIGLAALFDGAVSLLEGWALYRGFRWSGWLVVCSTSAAIPFEVIAVIRHASVVRILLLLTNALIVVYLVRRHAAVSRTQVA